MLPNVAIIDALGLNDRVVARLPPPELKGGRQMAHERRPPRVYVACFQPNVYPDIWKRIVKIRSRPLSDQEIRACETRDWSQARTDDWDHEPLGEAGRDQHRDQP
jgi:hypothetical protein